MQEFQLARSIENILAQEPQLLYRRGCETCRLFLNFLISASSSFVTALCLPSAEGLLMENHISYR